MTCPTKSCTIKNYPGPKGQQSPPPETAMKGGCSKRLSCQTEGARGSDPEKGWGCYVGKSASEGGRDPTPILPEQVLDPRSSKRPFSPPRINCL